MNVPRTLQDELVGKKVTSFVFIMDYYQVVFEDYTRLNIYSQPTIFSLCSNTDSFEQTSSISQLIGLVVTSVYLANGAYTIKFSDGISILFPQFVDGQPCVGAINGEDF